MAERALVVIPTYNEAGNLPLIVPAVLGQDPRLEILVVDDNSPDGTGTIADGLAAADPRVHVLHRAAKEGLGRAYLAGFRWALGRDYAYIFEMDADFSHDPKYLPDFLRAIVDCDLVLGSRYSGGVNVVKRVMGMVLAAYATTLILKGFAQWLNLPPV